MIAQRQVVYKRFLTKKKLSSFAWTHWGFALITTIGIGFLFTIIELIKINDRDVVFFNLRTVNTENKKAEKILGETNLQNNSPVFIFEKDHILFGPLRSVIAPKPYNDVMLLENNWKEEFCKKINYFDNRKILFPANVFGVIFQNDYTYEKNIEILKDTFEIINTQNKISAKGIKIFPSVVLLDPIKLK